MTQSEMPSRYGYYYTFKEQDYAPCLMFSSPTNLYCFTNQGGNLKKCQCFDNSKTYDNEWCNAERYGDHHTMCLYNEGAQQACGEVIHRGVTKQEDKDEIVNTHNTLRGKVARGEEPQGVDGPQPKASNMRE